MNNRQKLIGLFPAGGSARRLGNIPCSKEIISVQDPDGNTVPVGQFLTDAYRYAGADEILIISPDKKSDLRRCFSETASSSQFRHLPLKRSWGTPFTLDDAWPHTQEHMIILGFPDIILQPINVFIQLQKALKNSDSDVILGLFPTDTPHKADMVNLDYNGMVKSLDIKPQQTELKLTWITAIWRPRFTHFMHEFLRVQEPLHQLDHNRTEPFVGNVINAAIKSGLKIEGSKISGGAFLDIGTPEALEIAQSRWALGSSIN